MSNQYSGHMPDGSGIQQHSAGEHYPFVLVQEGLDQQARHGILHGGHVQWFHFLESRQAQLGALFSLKAAGGEAAMLKSFHNNPYTEDY